MRCDQIHELLGPFIDDEVSSEERRAVVQHVQACRTCAVELNSIRNVAERLSTLGSPAVPGAIWSAIATNLGYSQRTRRDWSIYLRPAVSLAACILLLVGGYLFFYADYGSQRATASTVNFAVMLDGMSVDPESAFQKFVDSYDGRAVSATEAKLHTPKLDFEIPAALPGGFVLKQAFAMRIGEANAAAAKYVRQGELLCAIFHPPVHPEDYGTHKDYPCVVGEHRGHRVDAGEWHLVHVTDETTCHCVLSKLDEGSELPEVLKAVAPRSMPQSSADGHSHGHDS